MIMNKKKDILKDFSESLLKKKVYNLPKDEHVQEATENCYYQRITLSLKDEDLKNIKSIQILLANKLGKHLNRSEIVKLSLRSFDINNTNLNSLIEKMKTNDLRRKKSQA